MSNALAIANVTQALALLIENNLRPEIDMAVSVETRKPPAEPPTEPTLNVFLYQVTWNPALRNSDLVTRASDGTLLKRAAAALDLHYVISAYGEETELVGQRLIGSVVRTLHEIPVLPRELIEQAAERPYLAGSDLAESEQLVRFTPTQMDVDETSKLWGCSTRRRTRCRSSTRRRWCSSRAANGPPGPARTRTERARPAVRRAGAPVPPKLPRPRRPRRVPVGGARAVPRMSRRTGCRRASYGGCLLGGAEETPAPRGAVPPRQPRQPRQPRRRRGSGRRPSRSRRAREARPGPSRRDGKGDGDGDGDGDNSGSGGGTSGSEDGER
ncbi:DUF4255 domain-containing protein [Streptomyces sp. M19]